MFTGMVSHSSWFRVLLVLPLSEGASSSKPCFSSCRLAEDSRAANAQNCLCMAKDGGDFIASWAFHIHEIGIGALHQALLLVFPLLLLWRGMKEILCKRCVLVGTSSPPERSWVFYTFCPESPEPNPWSSFSHPSLFQFLSSQISVEVLRMT